MQVFNSGGFATFVTNLLNCCNMNDSSLLSRITISPEICHGKPTIRGLRYTVEGILELLSAGDTIEDILSEFPDLTSEDVLACLAYATQAIKAKSVQVYPLAA